MLGTPERFSDSESWNLQIPDHDSNNSSKTTPSNPRTPVAKSLPDPNPDSATQLLRRHPSIPPSPALHIKIFLTRFLPVELVLPILTIAGLHRRTAYTRRRVPVPYRERQLLLHSANNIRHLVPPTLYLLSSPHCVRGIGTHPLHAVSIRIRFSAGCFPPGQAWFEARLLRDGRQLSVKTPLVGPISMDGRLRTVSVRLNKEAEVVRYAREGDRIGVWVLGDGERSGDWTTGPYGAWHIFRVLVEAREASIECFCCW